MYDPGGGPGTLNPGACISCVCDPFVGSGVRLASASSERNCRSPVPALSVVSLVYKEKKKKKKKKKKKQQKIKIKKKNKHTKKKKKKKQIEVRKKKKKNNNKKNTKK
eukprot:NODE_27299_length_518_cov_1.928389.p1 GENE.NODE_27299_length_518_cov_1.928389~~NODE_27299_length_518_cov_1.928389.p1  ORF type:complete len:107 (-),score=48.31 NODE_27299_length_518_cov_1.928389:15-335(-)